MAMDGGPAFPCEHTNTALQEELIKAREGGASLSFFDIRKLTSLHPGMSLRDWFAGQALGGFIARCATNEDWARLPFVVFEAADAMLAAREVRS